ncbi:hypothetical protein JHL21_04855 [Devosia sp. WQ 349]|uniref:hypothetical protein n=1 Tax=Devosia sp. WQ 349K1 TaxID=2800329 RepID=UPI001903EDCD|nr:hypothetical protein [Devosia sp. WQ 349K1]MBK1793820.1 hypothetical protein [Devosia sp. WQ 349K1]
MASKRKSPEPAVHIAEWSLPTAATLGSAVRTKGIMLEMRAKLPTTLRKFLDVRPGTLILGMPEGHEQEFARASETIERNLAGIEKLAIIPREIQDILTITTSERHRWLKDGRLPSAGTRTVKLHGRARKITFHVFDPKVVEDMLNDDKMSEWREQDKLTAAENRRQAAWKRRLAREEKAKPAETPKDAKAAKLAGWAEFEREGLLR